MILRQTAIILALGWMLAPLQFALSVLIARELGAHGKGVFAVLAGITAVLGSLAGLGITSGLASLYKQERHAPREIIGSAFALTAASSGAAFLLFAYGGEAWLLVVVGDQGAAFEPLWILLAVAAVPVAALSALGDVLLIVEDEMRIYAWRAAGTAVLAIALTWPALEVGFGMTGVLASQIVSPLPGLALLAWWFASRKADLGSATLSMSASRSLLTVGLQQHMIGLIALVAKRVDIFIVASFLSIQEAGYYAVAILLSNLFMTIPRATMWPLVRAFSSTSTRDQNILARASRLQVALMVLLTLALLPLAPLLVEVAFGSAFAPAASPLRWALAGAAATPITIGVNALLTARGRPGLSIASALAGTGVQIALTLALIEDWGIAASAAALSANYIVTAAVQLVIARHEGVMTVRSMLVPTADDLSALHRALRRWRAAA